MSLGLELQYNVGDVSRTVWEFIFAHSMILNRVLKEQYAL